MQGAGLRERPRVEAGGVEGTQRAARPEAGLAVIRARPGVVARVGTLSGQGPDIGPREEPERLGADGATGAAGGAQAAARRTAPALGETGKKKARARRALEVLLVEVGGIELSIFQL